MIVVVMGVSGSGKSTVGSLLARRLGWIYHEGDEFHSRANIEKMSKGIPLTDEDRRPWLESIRTAINQCVERGEGTVFACSALRARYRRILAENVCGLKFVYLKGNAATIRSRMRSREDHYMKAGMLESQFASLEEPDDAIVADIEESPERIVSQIESIIKAEIRRCAGLPS